MSKYGRILYSKRAIVCVVITCGATFVAPQAAEAACELGNIDRLALWCGVERANAGFVEAEEGRQVSRALYREGYVGGNRVQSALYIAPSLVYSTDVNGGNPEGVLTLGQLRLFPNDKYARKDGFLFGVRAGFSGRKIYGPGRYMTGTASMNLSHALAHDDSIKSFSAETCSKNHVTNWWYLDACLGTSRVEKTFSRDTQSSFSLAFSKAFTSSTRHHHLATVSINQIGKEEFTQTSIQGELLSIHADAISSLVSLSLGEEVAGGHLAMDYDIHVELLTEWRGRRFGLSASLLEESGGQILGYSRSDQEWSVGLSVEIRENISLAVGYQSTNSTIDYFDYESPIVEVKFSPYVF